MTNIQFEISHDILARKVYEKLSTEEKELRRLRSMIKSRQEGYVRGQTDLFTRKELSYLASFLPKLALSTPQKQFIENSEKAVLAQEQAEKEQQARELKLIQAQKQEAEKRIVIQQQAIKRQKRLIGGVVVLFLGALALGSWAFYERGRTEKAYDKLQFQVEVANEEHKKAEEALDKFIIEKMAKARTFLHLKQEELAIKNLKSILEVRPQHQEAKKLLNQLEKND